MSSFALRNLRLRTGEEYEEQVAVSLEPFLLGGLTYVVVPPEVKARLVVQRTTSGDVFRLVLGAVLDGPCMRCLSDASATLAVDATEYQDSNPGAPADMRTEYVADGELNLDRWGRDLVGFALPAQILCRPDCAGLCAVCGKNLNDEPHVHDDAPTDPRWAALESLLDNG